MRSVLVAPLALIVVALWATPTSAQSGVSVCGRVTAFTAATPTNDGSITIGTRSFVLRADALYSAVGQNRETLVVGREIPAGTVLPADAGSGSYCFTLTLGATNDVVVSGARPAEGGGAASSNTPPRNPPTLPNTSTAGERFGD
jgi:hypothetical protein